MLQMLKAVHAGSLQHIGVAIALDSCEQIMQGRVLQRRHLQTVTRTVSDPGAS